MDIRRDEWPQAVLMSAYFFLVITTFWILKPLKKGLFVSFYDQDGFRLMGWTLEAAQAELIAKVGNMFVAVLAVLVFVRLSHFLERQQLTYVFSAFSIVCLALFSRAVADPGALTVWGFYFFGDLFNTLMVATFFAFLNDSVEPQSAKRLYGLIGLGGVAGGAFGAVVLAGWIQDVALPGWLAVCIGMTASVAVIAAFAGRRFARRAPRPVREVPPPADDTGKLSGARLVFGSRYLLSIVAIVGLYEMVSTIMDFQFTSTVAHYVDGAAIETHFARVFAFTNGTALVVQLFLTSFVMTRFGVGTALLFLPVAALLGSFGFVLAPVLLFGSLLNTADNGFNYSINQSAKETLYTPTSRMEKYEAKAFIDMFVMRFAKSLAVGLSLIISTMFAGFDTIRWLSLVTVAILLLWIWIVRFAGKEFRRRSGEKADAAFAVPEDAFPSGARTPEAVRSVR